MSEREHDTELEFDSDAGELVRVAEHVARHLLSDPRVTPRQLATLAKALHAL
jgi:hypothetical protein